MHTWGRIVHLELQCSRMQQWGKTLSVIIHQEKKSLCTWLTGFFLNAHDKNESWSCNRIFRRTFCVRASVNNFRDFVNICSNARDDIKMIPKKKSWRSFLRLSLKFSIPCAKQNQILKKLPSFMYVNFI